MREPDTVGHTSPLRGWMEELERVSGEETRLSSYRCGVERVDRAVVEVGADSEIHVVPTRYDERSPPTVISFEVEGAGRSSGDATGCVVLDIYGDQGFDPGRDHFFVLEALSRDTEVKLRVQGPGSYSEVPEDDVDSWDAVLSIDHL